MSGISSTVLWRLIIFLLLLPLLSCDGDSDASGEDAEQEIYFIFQHFNVAWGYVHQGFFINRAGEIHVFNVEEGADSAGRSPIAKSELEEVLEMATSYYGETIDLTELNQMIALIPELESFEMSEIGSGCADSGTTLFSAFSYDPIVNMYYRIDISTAGYFPSNNLSEATPVLLEWINPYVQTYMNDFLPSIIGCGYE